MISSDLRVYIGQILNFLKTTTIKYSPLATEINTTLIRNGYDVNLDRPATWKYYLNAAGLYHVADTQMTVVSLDTRETIVFDKDVLVNHPRTAAAYRPGTSDHTALCERYPEQVDLIKSILFPVENLSDFIASDDITLAQYGSGFLEPWEEPKLIFELRKFLAVIAKRYHFKFLSVEPYFHDTFFGQLYVEMGSFLLAQRDALIRTPYVHSWHIWQYLQSNGLDNYSDILDRKKSLFLYQNWDYLKANSGKQSNLIILIDNLLTDIGIGIYGRRIVQQTHDGADKCQLTPMFVPEAVSTTTGTAATIASETVGDMQERLYANDLTASQDAETIRTVTRQLGDTTRNNVLTKFLEIRPIAADNRYTDILDIFVLDTLVRCVTSGLYNKSIEVTDPLSGRSIILPTKNCLALWAYCSAKSVGVTLTDIPTKYRYTYSRKITPDPIPDTYPWEGHMRRVSSYIDAQAYVGSIGYPTTIGKESAFSDALTALWEQFIVQLQSTELECDTFLYDLKMSLLFGCTDHIKEEPVTLVDIASTYVQWLGITGTGIGSSIFSTFDVSDDPNTNYGNLADAIMSAMVPVTSVMRFYGNYTLSDQGYARLRALFVQLCSYNVLFIDSSRLNSEYIIAGKSTIKNNGSHITGSVVTRTGLIDIGHNVLMSPDTDAIGIDSGIEQDSGGIFTQNETISHQFQEVLCDATFTTRSRYMKVTIYQTDNGVIESTSVQTTGSYMIELS